MDAGTMPAVPLPPGGPIEIVFSFDTTGSMSSCLPQVRANLAHVIERLNADIPGLRVAVFAHGDYCDLSSYGYVTKHIDFTNDVLELCKFVNEVGATGGGDFEECYELVLRQVQEELTWQPGTQRALVMIGDATPHDAKYSLNKLNIRWKDEVQKLANEMGVRIYGVQCLNNSRSDSFYRHLAESTGGKHLKLDQLTSIVDMMMAICYCERGTEFVEAFEQEVRNRNTGGMHADLERMFGTLKNKNDITPGSKKGAPVPALFSTPPSTPGSSKKGAKRYPVTSGCRPRSDSVSSDGSSGGYSLGSTASKGRRRSTKGVVHTRSKAHPMSRRTKATTEQTTKRRRTTTEDIKEKCTEKVLRERTARKDFLLANLRWSHWKVAMADETPKDEADEWNDLLDDRPGFKRTTIFPDIDETAVYEVAVQTPDCRQKVPVLASVTRGIHGRSWEAGLLSSPHVKSQVDKVLKRRCKLYIRRAKFCKEDLTGAYEKIGLKKKSAGDSATTKEAVNELRGLVTRTCDYAWRNHYDPESKTYTHRSLKKKGVVISE